MTIDMEEHELGRGDWEGFSQRVEGDEAKTQYFLGLVTKEFVENPNIRHIEDTIDVLIKKLPLENKQMLVGLRATLQVAIRSLIGDREWEILEKYESARIMEHEAHDGQGIG